MSVSTRTSTSSKISAESQDTVNSGFDLFAVPPTHVSVMRGEWMNNPCVRETKTGMLEFDVSPSDEWFTDLSETYIKLRVRVTKGNGDAYDSEANDAVLLAGDNFMHSLFSSATFKMCGQDVEYEANYPYRAYMENALNFGKDAKESSMFISSGWMEDGGAGKNLAEMTDAQKTFRKTVVLKSKEIEFYGKIRLGIFSQPRFLPPGIRFNLTLMRSLSPFCLLAGDVPGDGATVEITKAELWVRRIQANPALQKTLTSLIHVGGEDIKLPMRRVKTQFCLIPSGVSGHTIKISQNGQRPNRVFVALVDHKAKNGDYKLNPFKFSHNNLKTIELSVDGSPVSRPYTPDYTKDLYSREYMNLFAVTGRSGTDNGNCVTHESFKNNMAIYAFDISGDMCDDGGVHLISNGSISIDLAFSKETESTLSLFIYEEKDEIITIDPTQRISMIAGML